MVYQASQGFAIYLKQTNKQKPKTKNNKKEQDLEL